MSRGYLKNQGRKVGRKVARGGSSARSRRNKLSDDDQPKNKSCRSGGGRGSKGAGRRCTSTTDCDDYYADDYYFDDYDYGYDYIGDYECDDEIEQPHTQDVVARTGEQECSICCEVRPLVSLFRKCKHPPTCRECLREIYVNQAQEDVSNYPLRCFYPSCKRSVRGAQLIRHNLVRSDDELQRHYRLDVLQKHYRIQKSYARGVNIVHCPDCDFPRSVRENRSVVHCNQCKVSFAVAHHNVTNIMTTITAVEGIANDAFGINDGWARCPRCNIIISKGDGCDHIHCVCGWDFSWYDARKKILNRKTLKIAVSRSPSDTARELRNTFYKRNAEI